MGQGLANQCIAVGITICMEAYKSTNAPVDDTPSYTKPSPNVSGEGTVYLVISALDYKMTSNPLTCSIDGRNMVALAQSCGVTQITAMYDEQCTKDNVAETIEQVLGLCEDGDIFVYYYSGHGTNLQDVTGDEEDGQDEAFCFVTPDGQISFDSCMTDDDFAELITSNVPDGVRVLILTDCCHSGTICDFERDEWKGKEAISITGCLDSQTSGDIGRGGIFTHSMMCAIGELQDEGDEDYSTGRLYNRTLQKDEELFNSAQDITIQCSPGITPGRVPWPLVPMQPYTPPLERRQ